MQIPLLQKNQVEIAVYLSVNLNKQMAQLWQRTSRQEASNGQRFPCPSDFKGSRAAAPAGTMSYSKLMVAGKEGFDRQQFFKEYEGQP